MAGPEAPTARRRHRVVDVDPAHDRAVAGSLARAFLDDPVWAFLLPDDESRFADLARIFRHDLVECRRRGLALTTGDRGVAALWYPPGTWSAPPLDLVRAAPSALRSFRRRLPRALRTLAALEHAHPGEPHWYLGLLGSEPAHRGTGAAAAVLDDVLARCDRDGLPAYLESSKEANLAYYRRFGFEVTGTIALPGGGPPLWPMWRDPHPRLRS